MHVGNDEIGQVGQAIDAVRQTAIRSAIDEARVRQGVNDMFRNLARRNQSLLQRQLSVLDDMERRATDPDVLEDLFKMDHLTTRMRRHAEGLIILSGAPPGRSWSAPVKLIDVMRGAVAEVEDYARVTASTQSRAALSGSAVTDVIHLLAELIENATTLSPPFTQVRVGGESVANGFAIEIEDRGLGLSPQRLARAQRPAGEPAGHQPGQHRAARPVRRRAAGQAARDQRDAPAVALRRHHGGGADPAGAHRRGGPGRAARRAVPGRPASGPRATARPASRHRVAPAYVERRAPARRRRRLGRDRIEGGRVRRRTGRAVGAERDRRRQPAGHARRRQRLAQAERPARRSGTGRPAHAGRRRTARSARRPTRRRADLGDPHLRGPAAAGRRPAPRRAPPRAASPRALRPPRSPPGTAPRPAADGDGTAPTTFRW